MTTILTLSNFEVGVVTFFVLEVPIYKSAKLVYLGSSTETEILKIDHEFLQFFDWDQKYKCLRHHFQYLVQFIAPMGGSGAIQIFIIYDYGTSFTVFSTTMDFPS